MNYAVVDLSGLVVNVILWDGVASYVPEEGQSLVCSDVAKIGDIYADGVFTPPAGEGA